MEGVAFLVWKLRSMRVIAAVTAKKDVAPAANQAVITNAAAGLAVSTGGGLIKTTSG